MLHFFYYIIKCIYLQNVYHKIKSIFIFSTTWQLPISRTKSLGAHPDNQTPIVLTNTFCTFVKISGVAPFHNTNF